MHVRQLLPEARVRQHQPLTRIEQGKPVLHRLDRRSQVLPGRLRLGIGQPQPRVRAVQKVQRAFKVRGAGADLIFQQHRALELGIGCALIVRALFDPAHQHIGDLDQLGGLHFGRIGGVDEGMGHGISGG